MKKFLFNDIVQQHYTVIHCDTIEQRDILFKEANKRNFKWCSGEFYTDTFSNPVFSTRICYNICQGKWCYEDSQKDYSYKVEFEDVIFDIDALKDEIEEQQEKTQNFKMKKIFEEE